MLKSINQKKCFIISSSNVQNTRIRLSLFYYLNQKFDSLSFCGDKIVHGIDHQIEWSGASNRKGVIFELVIFLRLMLLLIKHRPSHIISFAPKVNIYCGILTRLFKIKHTAVISGLGNYVASITQNGSLLNKLFKISLSSADLVLTMNEFNYQFCLNTIGQESVRSIPSEGLYTDIDLSIKKVSDTKKVIVYLSRIISEKGIFLLIDAFRNVYAVHQDVELIIAGEIGLSEENGDKSLFMEKIKLTGINYKGVVSEQMKEDILNQANIVVLASMYGEGLPMILLEAQLYQCIIITTNVPGCSDAVSPYMQQFYCDYSVESIEGRLLEAINLSPHSSKQLTDSASLWVKQNHDINYVNSVYNGYFLEKSFYSV